MDQTTRRDFIMSTSAAAALLHTRSMSALQLAATNPHYQMVATHDRHRIITSADRYLSEQPITVTANQSRLSSGGPHDYFSQGDYWWPDPAHPNGPYIRRDGMSNPANFNAHREALIRLSLIVPALTAAWALTGQKKYADHAGRHLRAWFADPETRMNPNLEYAQAIIGVSKGRGTGIIDTLHLVEPARAAMLLAETGALKDAAPIKAWFADYLEWMRTSKNGQQERDAKNNHGACWVLQAAEFARFTGNEEVRTWCRNRFRTVLIPDQIAPDGSLPLELARTKPYSYSLFDTDVLADLCQSLSTKEDTLWQFTTPDGRGMKQLIAFMYPFIKDKAAWPYRHDVEHWNDFPVRQPSLLFAGIAYSQPKYIALWNILNPDPTVPEVIRNYPVRQPLLWLPRT